MHEKKLSPEYVISNNNHHRVELEDDPTTRYDIPIIILFYFKTLGWISRSITFQTIYNGSIYVQNNIL